MSKLFPHVFQPLTIRGKTFKNRLFFSAHGTGYAESGGVGDVGFAYYKARIERDIALLVTEATDVVPQPGLKYATLNASTDDIIPRVKRLADLCRKHDCLYFGQVFHRGRAEAHSKDGSQSVPIGPSANHDQRYKVVARAMSRTQIQEFVEHFGAAANRFYRAGADGTELLVGMGYMHAQFLSPLINQRTDEYGGSPEGRLRFLKETLESMRANTGEDFIIGIRIGSEEPDVDGLTSDVTVEACQALEKAGLVDYVNVTTASTSGLPGASMIVPPMFVDAGQTLPATAKVKRAISVPIFTCGRINQPQIAEQAIAGGSADMVGMVRAFITDPEFAVKAKEDRPDDIRACIACNQACIGHRLSGHGVSCIQYPETGRELDYGEKVPAETSKRVSVIGGGPAGMKAAVVAAQRGHDVTIFEKSGRLGGQANLAQALPGRAEFGGLITNLEREIERYGVKVVKNTAVSKEMILEDSPDAVVIATGAVPRIPEGEFDEAHMVTAWDVIDGKVNVGSKVVIADWRSDWVAMGLAEKLASEGCSVRLCTMGEMAGEKVQPYTRYIWAGRLHSLGVEVQPYLSLYGADSDTVYMQHVMTGEAVLQEDTETLVLAYGHHGVIDLYDELEGEVENLHAIGDCLSPRTAEEAILEGLKVGSIL